LRGRSVAEKSELWVTGKIQELLGESELPRDRAIDEHDLNEQAWLVTRRPKEVTTTAELRANVETTFRKHGFETFVAPQTRRETVTIGLDEVIDQGVQAVFERDSIVRTDLLVGEIVRLAPGQASNSEIEAATATTCRAGLLDWVSSGLVYPMWISFHAGPDCRFFTKRERKRSIIQTI
jgi:hypothetical protein